MNANKKAARPPVHMIDAQADVLADLAVNVAGRQPELSALLIGEIDRAKIHSASKIPSDVVTMGSQVEFTDAASGATRVVELVYPVDADIEAGRVSVLTPIGAGLIGLREGGTILWPHRDGTDRALTVTKVTQPDRIDDSQGRGGKAQ